VWPPVHACVVFVCVNWLLVWVHHDSFVCGACLIHVVTWKAGPPVYPCDCVVFPSFECVMTHANVDHDSCISYMKGRQYFCVCVCVWERLCECVRAQQGEIVCVLMWWVIFLYSYLERTRKGEAECQGKKQRERENWDEREGEVVNAEWNLPVWLWARRESNHVWGGFG